MTLLLVSCNEKVNHPVQLQNELNKLDAILEEKAYFEQEKDKKIEIIKKSIGVSDRKESLYRKYDWLADEYRQYRVDSAMIYSKKALQVARSIADSSYYYDAILDMTERYIVSGMYHDASILVQKLDTTNTKYIDLPLYYHRMRALNEGLAGVADDDILTEKYRSREKYYVEKLISVLDTNDIRYKYISSEILMGAGKADAALQLLEKKYRDPSTPVNEKAIVSYLMAQCYMQKGDEGNAILYYAESARLDLITPNYSYRSLSYLAALLYRHGDIDRAYRYMMRSIEDATISKNRMSISMINEIFPVISETYDIRMYRKNDQMLYMLIALSLTLLILTIVMITLFHEKKKVTEAQQETSDINQKLMKANTRLEKYIHRLQESNTIKESYISRYLDMCSEYIEAIAAYRSEIRKVSKNGSLADVQKFLKTSEFIDAELEKFYATFDTTFLDLFPNFIDRLNELLQPDKKILVDPKDGIMTTELRTMALIRLGITDSVKIADFLRRSPSTIYNYRVKFRNAAINNRDDFEKQVMSIERL